MSHQTLELAMAERRRWSSASTGKRRLTTSAGPPQENARGLINGASPRRSASVISAPLHGSAPRRPSVWRLQQEAAQAAMSLREQAAFEAHVRKREVARAPPDARLYAEELASSASVAWSEAPSVGTRLDADDLDASSVEDEDEDERLFFESKVAGDAGSAGRVSAPERPPLAPENRPRRRERLSEWIAPARNSGSVSPSSRSPRERKENGDFAAAIRRWQLHKGRDHGPGSAAMLAGVDASGRFVPALISAAEGGAPDKRKGDRGHEEEEMYFSDQEPLAADADSREVQALSIAQHRLLARCFVRWQRHWHRERELRGCALHVRSVRRRGLFRGWVLSYRAVRMHRLRMLLHAFDTWQTHAREVSDLRQVVEVGEAFREVKRKQFALDCLLRNVSVRRSRRAKNAKARAFARRRVLSYAMDLWRWHRRVRQAKAMSMRAAELFFRNLQLHRAIDVLRAYTRDQVLTRRVRAVAARGQARRSFCAWREALATQRHLNLQLEGARVVHEVCLGRRALRAWRRHAAQERQARGAEAKLTSLRKRQAFARLSEVALRRRASSQAMAVADLWRWERLTLAALATFAEHVVYRRQAADALALCDVQLLRRSARHWRAMAHRSVQQRRGAAHWRRAMLRKGLGELEAGALAAREREAQRRVSDMHWRASLLGRITLAWAAWALEASHARAAESAAYQLRALQLKRRLFAQWRRASLGKVQLARSYERVTTLKMARICFVAWAALAQRWIDARVALERGVLARAMLAWYDLAMERRMVSQALVTAAVFRRNRLMSEAFAAWEDFYCLCRSERFVVEMAMTHASRRLLRRALLGWRGLVAGKLPLNEESAVLWFENRLQARFLGRLRRATREKRQARQLLLCREPPLSPLSPPPPPAPLQGAERRREAAPVIISAREWSQRAAGAPQQPGAQCTEPGAWSGLAPYL